MINKQFHQNIATRSQSQFDVKITILFCVEWTLCSLLTFRSSDYARTNVTKTCAMASRDNISKSIEVKKFVQDHDKREKTQSKRETHRQPPKRRCLARDRDEGMKMRISRSHFSHSQRGNGCCDYCDVVIVCPTEGWQVKGWIIANAFPQSDSSRLHWAKARPMLDGLDRVVQSAKPHRHRDCVSRHVVVGGPCVIRHVWVCMRLHVTLMILSPNESYLLPIIELNAINSQDIFYKK